MSHDPERDYTYSAPGALKKRLAELDWQAVNAKSEIMRKTAEGLAALHRKCRTTQRPHMSDQPKVPPIDARHGTTKTDRALLAWFVFGVGNDGLVDIADQDGDIITNITRERADRIVALRNKFVEAVADIINAPR